MKKKSLPSSLCGSRMSEYMRGEREVRDAYIKRRDDMNHSFYTIWKNKKNKKK